MFTGAFAWIGNTELRGCLRCGATVLWSSARGGNAMELMHRRWHEEQDDTSSAEESGR